MYRFDKKVLQEGFNMSFSNLLKRRYDYKDNKI